MVHATLISCLLFVLGLGGVLSFQDPGNTLHHLLKRQTDVEDESSEDSSESGIEVDWDILIDLLFGFVQQQIIEQNLDELPIPDVNENFEKKLKYFTIRGNFMATRGFVKSLSSIKRTGEISFTSSGEKISLLCHLGFDVLEVRYDQYRIQIFGTGPQGNISASVGSNSIRLRLGFAIRSDGCNLTLDEVKVVDWGRGQVKVTGLGALDWLAERIGTWALEDRKADIVSKIESALTKLLMKAIGKFNCDEFFHKIRSELEKLAKNF